MPGGEGGGLNKGASGLMRGVSGLPRLGLGDRLRSGLRFGKMREATTVAEGTQVWEQTASQACYIWFGSKESLRSKQTQAIHVSYLYLSSRRV